MKQLIKIFTPVFLLMAVIGCKKEYLETKPSNAVSEQAIFESTDKINTAISSTYKEMFAFATGGTGGHDNFGQRAIDLAADIMGADIVLHQQGYNWFNRDYQYTEWIQPTPSNRRSDIAWFYYYDIIKQMNTIIANVDNAKGSQADKESLKGQALGMRAYAYYYLINYMQQTYKGNENKPGVPLYTEPALDGKARGTVQQVYDRIIADLTEAETLLNGKSMPSKVNMSVNVVRGFRARVALIMEDWATAASYALKARQGFSPMSAAQYSAGFSQLSNPEWMWGSQIPNDQATIYASFFSHLDVATQGYASLGSQKKIPKALYDLIPAGDVRKTLFVTPGTGSGSYPDYNQLKFRVPNPGSWAADYLYMRAGEMYLIEAEALARTPGQEAGARAVLETLVKARYPAYSAAGLSGVALINEVLLQRRIELWCEGFSLIDLKRLKTGLNRPTGPGNHGTPNFNPIVFTLPDQDPKFLMRIPQRELDNNAAMTPMDQNP
jgi:hypothetical protein